MATCPACTLFPNNTMTSFTITDQWGIYPKNIQVSGIITTTDVPPDKTGTMQSITADGVTFNAIVLSQNANLISKKDTEYVYEMNYTLVDKRYWWSTTNFQYKQNISSAGVDFSDFITQLKSASGVQDISIPDSAVSYDYLQISYDGSIAGAFDYLGRSTGLLPFYVESSDSVVYLDASEAVTPTVTTDMLTVDYAYPTFQEKGIIVSGELNHKPAPVNSVPGAELPTSFTFPMASWEFLSIGGESGLGLIPYTVGGTLTIKQGSTVTKITNTGLEFYAEAFLTYRWSPRGVVLNNFTLTAENRTCKKVFMGIDISGQGIYSTQCDDNNEAEVKIIDQSTLSSSNVMDALNFKDPDPSKYQDGFVEWFAVYEPSDDKKNQVISLICHRFWDTEQMITTSVSEGNTTTNYDVSLENDIKPIMWMAVNQAKSFASTITLKIDYGSSLQTIFPYSVTVGQPPYTNDTNNDVATTDMATQYGLTYLNTANARTMGYTVKGIESFDYSTVSRMIVWNNNYDDVYTKKVVRVG